MAGLHARRGKYRRPRRGRRLIAVVAALVVVVAGAGIAYALTGSSGGTSPSRAASSRRPGSPSAAVQALPVSLNIEPTDGATNLPLDSLVTVTSNLGRLTSVDVTPATSTGSSGSGADLAGAIDLTGQMWQSTAALAPNMQYTVTASATGPSGQPVEQVSHFATIAPKAILSPKLYPTDGLTVGIGEPIKLMFNHTVANKAALLSRLHVFESTPVPGGWYWFTSKELHFRPEQYWPTGEQVLLTADLAGFDAGDGIWATQNHSVRFTVGDAHVSTANVVTEQLTVTNNGQVVGNYPLSAGRTNLPTMGGVHIAVYKSQVVRMVSTTPGDSYDEIVYWDVNITDGGEFVHAAPWSTGAQGRSNVSHGCINLSPANATAFFNFTLPGDIVQVVGSPRSPSTGDHGTMDWTEPWAQYTPAVVGPLPPGPPAVPAPTAA